MQKSLKELFTEYGVVFVVVYFAIFFLVWFAFWIAIRFGWEPTSAAGTAGTWLASYLATKVTQPFRTLAALAITPFVAKLYERMMGRAAVEEAKRPET